MISTKEGINKYSEAGIHKAEMPVLKMFVLAAMSGVFISVAGITSMIASLSVENPSVARLIVALIFPAGLAMVVVNGAELFTGNNLMLISVLDKKIKLKQMLRNWGVVYLGNFAGSLLITGMCTLGNVYSAFNSDLARSALVTAAAKTSLPFTEAFIKAIFCNILVCVAVMMTMMADTLPGRIAALYLPIMAFVICGFEHSVANMCYISQGLFVNMEFGNLGVDVSGLTWYHFLISNLLPVTLGNIVGGCTIGSLYWYTNK